MRDVIQRAGAASALYVAAVGVSMVTVTNTAHLIAALAEAVIALVGLWGVLVTASRAIRKWKSGTVAAPEGTAKT
jgi:hypothetical protein